MSTFQPGSESNDLDRLLENGSWVRRLAVRLLRDENLADDVLQEVWITAIQRPPTRPEALRAWLSVVVRSLCQRAKRTIIRRKRIEGVDRSPAAEPSADQIEERLEGQRRLLAVVLSLGEPYRTVIYLHFYDGLKLVEIARLRGATDSTVRTQLARGLEKLRDRLDRDLGGRSSARSVLLALVVPAWFTVPGKTAAACAAKRALSPRVRPRVARRPWASAAASTSTVIALVALVPLLLRSAPRGDTRAPVEGGAVAARTAGGSKENRAPDPMVQVVRDVRPREAARGRIVVVDSSGGRPVNGAKVYRAPRTDPRSTLLGETGPEGVLEVNDAASLRDPWIVLAEGFVERREAAALRETDGTEHVIALEREITARVAIVTEDGAPATGVEVTVVASARGLDPEEPWITTTDVRGEAEYIYRHPDTTIGVKTPGHVGVSLPAEPPRMTIRLRRGAAVEGIVVGSDGEPLPGCRVRLESPSLRSPTTTIAGDGGRFGLGVLDPNEDVTVRLRAPGLPPRRFTGRPPGAGPWRFTLPEGFTLEGAVTGPDGRRVAGGHAFVLVAAGASDAMPEGPAPDVRAAGLPPSSRATRRLVTRSRAEIGADGRFTLGPVATGDAEAYFFVHHPDYARRLEPLDDLASEAPIEVRLERGTTLNGTAVHPGGAPLAGVLLHFGQVWSNGVECVLGRTRVRDDGTFTIAGLPGGLGAPLAGARTPGGDDVVLASVFVAAFAPDRILERADDDVAAPGEISPGAFEVSDALARGREIRLVGAAKERLAALDVRLRDREGLPVRTWARSAVIDPDGAIQLGLLGGNLRGANFFSDERLATERVRGADLVLLSDVYRWLAAGALDLREGGVIDAVLDARSARPWSLRVRRADGSPVAGREIFVALPFGAAPARAAASIGATNADGDVATTALPQGRHLIAVPFESTSLTASVVGRRELESGVAWSWATVEDGGSVELQLNE